MTAAIDTNVLIDILLNDPQFFEQSRALLEEYSARGALMVCPVVYGEILTQFIKKFGPRCQQRLDQFLRDIGITIAEFSSQDVTLASERWYTYIQYKSLDVVDCPECGHRNMFACQRCKRPVRWRNHILSDFLIGSHAQNHAEVLLTRDRGFYKKYFSVKLA